MNTSRRAVTRSLFALTATAVVSASTGCAQAAPPGGNPLAAPQEGERAAPGDAFDELYRGRRIQGPVRSGDAVHVLIDGRPLHLMRRADGGYMSAVDHYQSCATPHSAARAAVDVLGSARLSHLAADHGGHSEGSPHGVHA